MGPIRLIFIVGLFCSGSVHAAPLCIDYLVDRSLAVPVSNIAKDLSLPYPIIKNTKVQTTQKPNHAFHRTLDFFKPDISKLRGATELFKILEKTSGQFSEVTRSEITSWAKSFLPGYQLLFIDQLREYKFANSYHSPSYPAYNSNTGILDDKFLFELYAQKKIPILRITDLLSVSLLLAQPELRKQFEIAMQLYERALALGDLTPEDQLQGAKTASTYSDLNRLQYLSTVINFMIKHVVFINSDKKSDKLVLWGSQNLINFAANQVGHEQPQDVKRAIDLSLHAHSQALKYFAEQSQKGSNSVKDFFDFLVQRKLLSPPASTHISLPEFAHASLNQQLNRFDINLVQSNFEAIRLNESFQSAWLRFSRVLRQDNQPATQLLHYRFRFELIKLYLAIAEDDIASDELR